MKKVSLKKYKYDSLNAKVERLTNELNTKVEQLADELNSNVEKLEKFSERVSNLERKVSNLEDASFFGPR